MKKDIFKNLVMLSFVGLILTLMPVSASATYLTFTIDESTVPLSGGHQITVDKLNGGYVEVISFDNALNFTSSAYADFGQYYLGGGIVSSRLNNDIDPYGYGLYATFFSTGSSTGGSNFVGNNANIHIFIDPNRDTTKALGATGSDPLLLGNISDDYEVMYSTELIRGEGAVQTSTRGAFDFVFGNPTLTNPAGLAFFPSLPQMHLQALVNGDFDQFTAAGNVVVRGDVSAQFEVVPEPATLSLLALDSSVLLFSAGRNSRP